MKVLPASGWLATVSWPPMASARPRARGRPRPAPCSWPCSALNRSNATNSRPSCPAGIPGPAAGTVRADERRLRQVLINLVTNAVRYNRPEGTVEVSAAPAGRVVTIDVTDTGPGIPAGQLGRLFVAFDRLSAEHGHEQGAGLGLPLARGLAEAMGGELTVTSHPDSGSTFTVRLPRAC